MAFSPATARTRAGEALRRPHNWVQLGKFSLAGEGLNVGKEGAEPVTDDYPGTSPWAFVGGTIHEATMDVAGDPWVDLEQEMAGAFARD